MSDPLRQEARPIAAMGAYFNGFSIAIATSDFTISLRLDNRPIIELKASYTTVKTLAEKLTWAVDQFEKATKHPLMTIEDVKEKLASAEAEKQKAESK